MVALYFEIKRTRPLPKPKVKKILITPTIVTPNAYKPIASRENNIPQVGQDLEVLVTWMSQTPLSEKKKVVIKHTTNECLAIIKQIKYRIDINTLHRIEDVNCIEMNDIARISIRSSKLIFYDSYKKNRQTGSLIIIDNETNETIGAAMIIK